MEPQATELTNDDVKLLLKGILSELNTIGVHMARQGEQIERLQAARPINNPRKMEAIWVSKNEGRFLGCFKAANPNQLLSMESRLGPLLEESLQRYKSNAVPYWSTLYGTHLADEEHSNSREEEIRTSEWTSVTGEFWRIPHDNRVTFCFLAALCDPTILIKVRNFLLHFHKLEGTTLHKDSCFHVWDWFDSGLSAYWCPGRKMPALPKLTRGVDDSRMEGVCRSSIHPTTLSRLVAPWRRIINLQGLTTLSNCEESFIQEDLSPSDLCPFLFSDSTEAIFHQPTAEMIWRAVNRHLNCKRTVDSHHAELEIKGCILFHITFFEILKPTSGKRLTEMWLCGELHSDGQENKSKPRQIRESALTASFQNRVNIHPKFADEVLQIMAIPCNELPDSKMQAIFWTMICLRPSQFPHLDYSENIDDLARRRTHEMIDEMSDFIHKALLAVVGRWEEIAEYFDEILSEKKGLLNPQYHDSLLTDDGAFSRSKKYFWALGFLEEAGNSISHNILQTERFVALMKSIRTATKMEHRDFQQRMKKHDLTVQKLQELQIRFRHKKKEVMALRDGLFSASSVIESRTSTQLGENIRLLTFVSIFFLPLTFCTVGLFLHSPDQLITFNIDISLILWLCLKSLWSISDTLFSLSSFAATLPIVSFCTYTFVFNINNIVSMFKPSKRSSLIGRFIEYHINEMQSDEEVAWKARGDAFGISGAFQQRKSRPSRWRILQFAVRRLFLKKSTLVPNMGGLARLFLWRQGQIDVSKNPPALLGNLGDIRVRVQVDVESCGESQK